MRLELWLLFCLAGTGGAQRQTIDDSSWATEMLTAHNSVRAMKGIVPLAWSSHLAAYAQQWADTLAAHKRFGHRPKTTYGENLFEIMNATASPTAVVKAWADESRNYNYRTNHCHGDCGHYTQIVWAATREVGCGVARFGNREIWVCDYDPPGNWVGQRPY
jgi:pathogenesis-related protein 1